jgi:hypothetical protein
MPPARAVVVIGTKKPDSLSSVDARSDLKKLNIAFRNPGIAAAERLVERYTAAVYQFDFPPLLLQEVNVVIKFLVCHGRSYFNTETFGFSSALFSFPWAGRLANFGYLAG